MMRAHHEPGAVRFVLNDGVRVLHRTDVHMTAGRRGSALSAPGSAVERVRRRFELLSRVPREMGFDLERGHR